MNHAGGERMQVQRRAEPPSLDALAAVFQAPGQDPSHGEIWRAAWATCVQIILIVEVGDADVDVVPVSPDLALTDDETVRVNPAPPLTHPLGAWCGLRRRLPIRVLDVQISTVTVLDLEAVRDGAGGEGAPITSVLDEREQLRASLADRMAELAAATWLPSSLDTINLGELLRECNLSPSKLGRELGVVPGDIIDIVRGDRALSPEQAEILSPLVDVEPEQLLSVQVDPDLVWALDRPQVRQRLAERGRAEHETDEAAWRLQVATRKLPVAARTSGSTDPRRRWMGLIEAFLDDR